MIKLFLILFIFGETSLLLTQWQNDVRLTSNNGTSSLCNNNGYSVAAFGNNIHIVWFDNRSSNSEIFYIRSTNNGTSWSIERRLTNSGSDKQFPVISISETTVHIAWFDENDDEIYYMRSIDNGLSWPSNPTRLTFYTGDSRYPTIASQGSNVIIVWQDNRDNNYEIFYKRSTNGGLIWESNDGNLSGTSGTSEYSTVTVSNNNVHVAWQDQTLTNYEIFYKNSPDFGESWSISYTNLSSDPNVSRFPSITSNGNNVHVVWQDDRAGNNEIYYKNTSNNGLNWALNPIRVTSNSGNSLNPSIICSATALHVGWYDDSPGDKEIYYTRSTNNGINWVENRLTTNSGSSLFANLSISNSNVYAVWSDNRDGNYEIYFKHNPNGNPFGVNTISTEIPTSYYLYQNYPNPFNPNTKIKFQVPKFEFVNIEVYDALGRYITTLVKEDLHAGIYEVEWIAMNQPNGIYFYRLMTTANSEVRIMVLIK